MKRKWPFPHGEESRHIYLGALRHNAEKGRRRDARRAKLLALIMAGTVRPEEHAKIMELLDVASTTAWRDKTAVMALIESENVCPTCGRAYPDQLLMEEVAGR